MTDPMPHPPASGHSPQPGKGFGSRLATRLAMMILVALLPLGLLSVLQSRNTLQQTDDALLLAAIGETLQVGVADIRMTRSAQNAARLLASTLTDGLGDAADCRAKVQSFALAENAASLVAFIQLDGRAVCTSDGSRPDFSGHPRFRALIADPAPAMFVDPDWSPGAEVLAILHPVRDAAGALAGLSLVHLPQKSLAAETETPLRTALRPGAILIVMGSTGEMFFSSIGSAAAREKLPQGQRAEALRDMGVNSFFGTSLDGKPHIFATVPIAQDLLLLGIWPHSSATGFWQNSLPYVLPLMTWLAAVVVAVIGSHEMVVRPIRGLAQNMYAFAGGARNLAAPALRAPPAEIAGLADAYRIMTSTILRDEAELENLLRQKEELLREVHHRTGNSLQLIASFLRMHRREAQDDEVRLILDDLHNRVMSLSSVHMGLYRMAGQADVAVDALMAEVVSKVGQVYGRTGRRARIQSELAPVVLTAQQAVPLALFLAEALSAFPVGEAEGSPIRIRLVLLDDNRARLSVSGSAAARGRLTGERDGAPSIIAARLIRGFASQLNGMLEVHDLSPSQVEVSVSFAIRLANPSPSTPETESAPRAGGPRLSGPQDQTTKTAAPRPEASE